MEDFHTLYTLHKEQVREELYRKRQTEFNWDSSMR